MVTDLQIFNGFTQLRYKSMKSVNSYDMFFPRLALYNYSIRIG